MGTKVNSKARSKVSTLETPGWIRRSCNQPLEKNMHNGNDLIDARKYVDLSSFSTSPMIIPNYSSRLGILEVLICHKQNHNHSKSFPWNDSNRLGMIEVTFRLTIIITTTTTTTIITIIIFIIIIICWILNNQRDRLLRLLCVCFLTMADQKKCWDSSGLIHLGYQPH